MNERTASEKLEDLSTACRQLYEVAFEKPFVIPFMNCLVIPLMDCLEFVLKWVKNKHGT